MYIQPEGFGRQPQRQTGFRQEMSQSFQTTEQKTGGQTFKQRYQQQSVERKNYVNGSSSEDFKVNTVI